MARLRVKNRFLKLVCLIIFTALAVKCFLSVKTTYSSFKKEVEIESGSILLPFKIRRENFFVTNPLYIPSQEKSNVIIKKNGMELTLEEIIKKDDEIAKATAEQFAAAVTTATESGVTVSSLDVTANSEKEDEILEVVKTDDIKSIMANVKPIKNESAEKLKNLKTTEKEEKIKTEKKEQKDAKEISDKKEVKDNSGSKKGYYIQLGIFSTPGNAKRLQQKLKGYNIVISEEKSENGRTIYRATIEGMSDRASAEEAAQKLKSQLNGEAPIVKVRY